MKKNNFFLTKNNFLFLLFFLIIFYFNNFLLAVNKENQEEKISLKEISQDDVVSQSTETTALIVQNKDVKKNNNQKKDDFFISDSQNFVLINDYQKDNNKEYFSIIWKHDLGSFFSKKVKFFYNFDSVQTLPCACFYEWLNMKQLFFHLIDHHIPKINFLFDFINFSGIKEEFIDDKYEKVALETTSFCRFLKKNPENCYFYFKNKDLKIIDKVNISFCNCKTTGYSVFTLIKEIINFQNNDLEILKNNLISYFKNLRDILDQKEFDIDEIDVSFEEILDKIVDFNDELDVLDKDFIRHLFKNLNNVFVPEFMSLHFSIEKKNIKPLKEMELILISSKEHKTIGFALKIEKDNLNNFYLSFYEIFKDDNEQEKLKLVDKVLISYSKKTENVFFNHLSVNVSQRKKISFFKTSLFGAIKI